MTPEQNAYAIAKAQYDTIKAICDNEKAPIHKDKTLTSEQWAEQTTAIEYKYNYWKAFDVLIIAERDLVTTTQKLLQTKRPGDYARVRVVFEKVIYNEELRQKRVDLCLRLNVGTI